MPTRKQIHKTVKTPNRGSAAYRYAEALDTVLYESEDLSWAEVASAADVDIASVPGEIHALAKTHGKTSAQFISDLFEQAEKEREEGHFPGIGDFS
jgi:predicted DNA-binding protein